jgi:hypothetical protein
MGTRVRSVSVESVMIPVEQAENKFVLSQPASQVKLKTDLLGDHGGQDQEKPNPYPGFEWCGQIGGPPEYCG